MNSKKLLPLTIFLITIALGVVSIVLSFKLQKKETKEGLPEIFLTYCEAYPNEPCCDGGGPDVVDVTLSGKVYCQDEGETTSYPIEGAQIHLWNHNRDGSYILHTYATTDVQGNWSKTIKAPEPEYDWGVYISIHGRDVSAEPQNLPDKTLSNGQPYHDMLMANPLTANCPIPDTSCHQHRSFTDRCRQPPEYEPTTPIGSYLCSISNSEAVNNGVKNLNFRYTNCSPLPAKSFVCQDLSRSPVELDFGNNVTFTCSHQTENVGFDHYEFRWQIDGGEWVVLEENNTSGTSGPYTIDQVGIYHAQCRACATTGTTPCTDWGQAGGWVE